MTEMEAVDSWLRAMQRLTGKTPDELLSFGPDKPILERKALLVLAVMSIEQRMQFGEPGELGR